MRAPAVLFVLAIAIGSGSSALAATDYTTNFNGSSQVSQSTPQSRSVGGALPWSNGTGTFAGTADASPGSISATTRTDCNWESGFSGSFGSWTKAHISTDDLIITGPGGPVHGTIHVHVSAGTDGHGGFPDNGAAYTGLFWFYAGAYGRSAVGQVNWTPFTTTGQYWLGGVTARSFDLDIPIEADYPVNTPFFFEISTEVDATTYGNVFYNPGMSQTWGAVSLGSGGVVMDLPAGYSLNSTAWAILNNQVVVGVADTPRVAAFQLSLVSANPMAGEALLRLSLPQASRVHAAVYDVMGRTVRTLLDGWQEAGVREVHWDGRTDGGASAATGIYFARLSAGRETATIRIARMK